MIVLHDHTFLQDISTSARTLEPVLAVSRAVTATLRGWAGDGSVLGDQNRWPVMHFHNT